MNNQKNKNKAESFLLSLADHCPRHEESRLISTILSRLKVMRSSTAAGFFGVAVFLRLKTNANKGVFIIVSVW